MDRGGASRWGIRAAALASLFASALHSTLVSAHIAEWWLTGLFFIAASLLQGLYGLVLLALPPVRPAWAKSSWDVWKRKLFWGGIWGNLAILALYAITRTVGIPGLGAQAAQVQPVGAVDALTLGAEVLTVAWLGWALRMMPATAPGQEAWVANAPSQEPAPVPRSR